MSDSREESPDWLRSFQPPIQPAICLSSGSESPLSHSPITDDDDDDDDDINLSKLFKKDVNKVPDIKDNDNEDERETEVNKTLEGKSLEKHEEIKLASGRKRKNMNDDEKRDNHQSGKIAKGKSAKRKTPQKHEKPHGQNHSVFALSSDSESYEDATRAKKNKVAKKELLSSKKDQIVDNGTNMEDIILKTDAESPKSRASKVKSPTKILRKEDDKTLKKKIIDSNTNEDNDANNIAVKDDTHGIHTGHQVSSSRLPLLLSEKVQYSKALVECEGDSIDLSGDVGAVGRIVISDDHSKNHDVLLDLKGTIYRTTIVPSRTFCVVSFGQSEAKIEAVVNDYIQLEPQCNVYEAETMVEGTLDGFSFDSEDEADNNLPKSIVQGDQDEAAEEQPTGKAKRKAQKTVGGGRNKGKAVGGKPAKKVKKRPQVTKKSKIKK